MLTEDPSESFFTFLPRNIRDSLHKRRSSLTDNMHEQNLTILNSINIMGSCVPYEIEFVPPEIYVPNEIPINTTEKLYFRVINKSESNIIFDWEFCEDDYIINISPQNGQLEKLETCVYEICISSTKPSKMYKKLKYQIKSSDQKYQNNFYLPIQAIFLSPDIIPMPSKIDMNILEIKKTFSTKLVILNKKKIQSKWNIETLDDMKKKVDINITPNNGYFLNEWQQDILIHFKFKETGKYSIHFKVFHQDIIFSYFTVNCRVNQASLIITPTTVNIIDGFRDTPCSISTIYANQSKLVDKLTIQPNEGTLCSNQSQKIDIEITINQQNIELNEIIRCYIGDESIPIFFIITGKVKYIDYSLEIIDSSSNEEIHFIKTGNSYQPINLILTNHSAIASKFQLLFENFHFNNENYFELDENITLTPKEKNILKHVKYVYKDINKNDRNIKTTYGVVFIMEYDSDILFPFEKKEIKIVPICDMFGVYDDKLRVQIADLEEKVISVNLVNSENVIKTIQSKLNTNIPIIRFGSMLSYDGVVKRSIKLTNTSNSYISIDWQFYNDTDKDDKLVNFSILFGDYIFPNSYEFEEMDLINGYNSSDKEKLLACFVDDYCGVCVDNIIKVDDNKTEFKPLEQKKVTFYLNPKFANLGNFNGFIKGYAKCLENITEKNVHRFRKIDTEQIQIKIHAIIWNAEFIKLKLSECTWI
ncbi:hypothetical protein A3Q56_03799 [Intoshia linei]|uniref:Uncharacterized protein n=1 Tax=Intoshia linei TaxID=1819745 RepID=A0A177B2S0_9BILA|nr:hypothetical protein A3Q56_03799 [Intoshia linei]